MKRMMFAAIACASLVLGTGSAFAGNGNTTVDVFPVSFTMSSDTCSNLPPGTTVDGSGTGKSITTVTTDHSGVTTVANVTVDIGTATDQAHNHYVFFYFNQFKVSNTLAHPDTFTGVMFDRFTLTGHGPANLRNGFEANITTDLETFFAFDPISSFGDPLDFAAGTARCDPL
jgi:hypothetical protein